MSHRTDHTAQNPCPVCLLGSKGCNSAPADFGDGLKVRCRGTNRNSDWEPQGPPGANGYVLYRHRDDLARGFQSRRDQSLLGIAPTAPKKPKPKNPTDWGKLAASYVRGFTAAARAELALQLGVSSSAFGAVPGWGYEQDPIRLIDGEPVAVRYWTHPETDGAGNVVGIEKRYPLGEVPDGEKPKMAFPGCNRGIVIPSGWRELSGPVLGVEGVSCQLAALSAELCAVSRPGNNSGTEHLVELFRDLPASRDIIIVGENDLKANGDWPGRDGARTVATKLSEQLGRDVKWALPPVGLKDSRDWLKDGGPWSHLSWPDRGTQLLTHLVANAVATGPKPEPAVSEPVAVAVAHCPLTATAVASTLTVDANAADVSNFVKDLLAPTCRCENPRILIGKRPSTGKRGAVPFGCHKNACAVCGLFKKRTLFEASEAYVERLTNPATNNGEAYSVYMTVVPSSSNVALKRAVERKHGKYLAIDTTDPIGTGEAIAGPEVSHLGHENPAITSCPKCDTSAEWESYTLWTILLPDGALPPRAAEFVRVTNAAPMLRAWGNALTTTPSPPDDDTKRFRFWRASRAWGEKIEKPIGDFKPEGVAVYPQDEIRKLVQELRVASEFWFADPKVQGRPVGWNVGPAASLCVSLLLRGVDAPHRYSIARVGQIAKEWIDYLPPILGDGWRVEQLLREHLWTGTPLVSIHDELRQADEQDRAEEAAFTEASTYLAGLRETYRGRHHELTGLLAELLA